MTAPCPIHGVRHDAPSAASPNEIVYDEDVWTGLDAQTKRALLTKWRVYLRDENKLLVGPLKLESSDGSALGAEPAPARTDAVGELATLRARVAKSEANAARLSATADARLDGLRDGYSDVPDAESRAAAQRLIDADRRQYERPDAAVRARLDSPADDIARLQRLDALCNNGGGR